MRPHASAPSHWQKLFAQESQTVSIQLHRKAPTAASLASRRLGLQCAMTISTTSTTCSLMVLTSTADSPTTARSELRSWPQSRMVRKHAHFYRDFACCTPNGGSQKRRCDGYAFSSIEALVLLDPVRFVRRLAKTGLISYAISSPTGSKPTTWNRNR